MIERHGRSERAVVVLVALLALAAALAGIDARATYGARVTADEPQYLLTAQSLAHDGSLDISDEIDSRAYSSYHEITIDRQTSVLDGEREVSPHDPLLPALLVPAMWLGGWELAKLTLAIFGAATAATATWIAIRRFGVTPLAAGLTIGGVFAGVPLATYGTQVYPEMPAAFAVAAAFGAVTAPALTRRHRLVAVIAVVSLPWLAIKYIPIAAVLAVGLLLAVDRRRRVVATIWFGIAGAVYLGLHQRWYGGWTAYSTGDHFEQTGEFSVVGTDVDLIGRTRRLVGLLIDREFGIGAWSPIWLLLPIAAALIVCSRRPGRWLWLGVVTVGWLNATFVALTMHGWWVPGRQLVAILPVAAIGIACLADRHRALLAPVGILGALGAVNWIWLAIEASTDRRTLVVDFMDTTAFPYRAWSNLLPSGTNGTAEDLVGLAVWTGVIISITGMLVWRWADRRPAR